MLGWIQQNSVLTTKHSQCPGYNPKLSKTRRTRKKWAVVKRKDNEVEEKEGREEEEEMEKENKNIPESRPGCVGQYQKG